MNQGGDLQVNGRCVLELRSNLQDELAAVSCVHVKIPLALAWQRTSSPLHSPVFSQDFSGIRGCYVGKRVG
jgi:hypothetical protein